MAQLLNGSVDAATGSETQMLLNSIAEPGIRIVMTLAEARYRIIARQSSGIRRIQDLRGKKVAATCHFYIQFGSQETREYCLRKGYLEIFQKAGARVIEPSCGACINAGPGVSTRPDQVVISAQNRNFPGRSGPGQMYLASPLTVAASAVAGYIVEYEPSQERELVEA